MSTLHCGRGRESRNISCMPRCRVNVLNVQLQKVSYKHNVKNTILRSRSISQQFWVKFFVVVLGFFFRFPKNLEKNLRNKSFRKSYFLTFWFTLIFYNGTRSLLIFRSIYQFKKTNRFKKIIWFPQRFVFTSQISIA